MSARRGVRQGIIGGLAGGMVFGMLMAMMGMLPMIGAMVGIPSAAAGFIVHLVISAAIGVGFAATLGRAVCGIGSGLRRGMLYGGAWWLLGPLTLMPLMMGMGLGANWNADAVGKALPSLMGHLLYGAVLGATYARLGSTSTGRPIGSAATTSAAGH